MRTVALTLLCGLLWCLPARGEEPRTFVYAIHLGVNLPPPESGLPALQYADDDAARFFLFTRMFTEESLLFAVLDEDSQRRFPSLAQHSRVPERKELERVLDELRGALERHAARNEHTVVLLTYSGHGLASPGGTRLSLLSGEIDRRFLEERLLQLPASAVHLVVDACHSEDLLTARGAIQQEASAADREIPFDERQRLTRELLLRFPRAGVLLASGRDKETHEWSRLSAGVFSHEVLSALAGAADVNGDGEIAYSEVAAFVSAANQAVEDPRALVQVIAHAPGIDPRTPLMSRRWVRRPTLLQGVPRALGHFFIELENGVRWLDANPEEGASLSLLLPPGTTVWVRSSDLESAFSPRPGEARTFRDLEFSRAETAARGAATDSLRRGFFRSRFGRSFYQGWVQGRGEIPVPLGEPSESVRAESAGGHEGWRAALMVSGGGGVLGSVIFGILAGQAWSDYQKTDLQRPATEAYRRWEVYTSIAVGSAVLAAGSAVALWWLWPEKNVQLAPLAGPDALGVSLFGRW
ncbi:MAG: hypothetical protein GYA21_19495 [Myxococcales bacterium]|nr:hypothetical protein [Myxococcales bacterium]